MYKNINRGKKSRKARISLDHTKLTLQLTFKNRDLKVDYHTAGKWFTHGPKHRERETVAKPGTLLLIIIIILCKCDKEEVRGSLPNPLF